MNVHDTHLTVDVYVRPAQLLEPIDAKIETLHRLESNGPIDELTMHAWPETISLSERTPYDEALEAFERIETWARRHGRSVRPPFSVRTTESSITGETQTRLRTPVMCLAVSIQDRLANVFPHSIGDEHYGVTEAIASLTTGEIELLTHDVESTETPPDACPECGDHLLNVQGIGVCQRCDRIVTGTTLANDDRDDDDRPEGIENQRYQSLASQ